MDDGRPFPLIYFGRATPGRTEVGSDISSTAKIRIPRWRSPCGEPSASHLI